MLPVLPQRHELSHLLVLGACCLLPGLLWSLLQAATQVSWAKVFSLGLAWALGVRVITLSVSTSVLALVRPKGHASNLAAAARLQGSLQGGLCSDVKAARRCSRSGSACACHDLD